MDITPLTHDLDAFRVPPGRDRDLTEIVARQEPSGADTCPPFRIDTIRYTADIGSYRLSPIDRRALPNHPRTTTPETRRARIARYIERAGNAQDLFTGEQLPFRLVQKTHCGSCRKKWKGIRTPPPHTRPEWKPRPMTQCLVCRKRWPGHVDMPPHTRTRYVDSRYGYIAVPDIACEAYSAFQGDWGWNQQVPCPAETFRHTSNKIIDNPEGTP